VTRPIDDLLAGLPDGPGDVPPTSARFSVVVRTQGRRPNSLAETIQCLADQTYDDFEVIVAVHSPDPTTMDQVRSGLSVGSAPDEIQFIQVTGGGRSRPLNRSLDAATGDYLCILDDDDLASVDWLEQFAKGAARSPGSVLRAVSKSQHWATDGGNEPLRPTGERFQEFATTFDLLAHFSHNETPPCSMALPVALMRAAGISFDEELAVYEDWDILMRTALLAGVEAVDADTSTYRRLDSGSSFSVESEAIWHATHARVLDKLSSGFIVLPPGDARRLASAHFEPGSGSRHDRELTEAKAELDALTRSPRRWMAAFGARLARAVNARVRPRQQ
jgi:glycosyltransferase involved in cell wall biosynthesis